MTQRLRKPKLCVLILITIITLTICAGILYADRIKPYNKVVIIIDSSGSFKSRQVEAIRKTTELLKAISQTRVHRWEKAIDRITLISLDAIPEVLWSGSVKELKQKDPSFWTARFRGRRDYVLCTDVGAAFRLAVRNLDGDPRYVHKYMFVFSDLVDEAPSGSIYKPGRRNGSPPSGFPWDSLRDVSVSVFWLPANQKLVWRRAVEQHGLESFALYTASESSSVSIQPPPRPSTELTESERKILQKRYLGYVMKFLIWGAVVMVIAVGLLVAAVYVLRSRAGGQVHDARDSQQSQSHAGGSGSSGAQLNRPVAPRNRGR